MTGLLNLCKTMTLGRNPRHTFIRVAVLVVATFLVFKFMLLPVRVSKESMLPRYQDGQIKFINRLAFCLHEPARGDVVGIWKAGHRVMLLKRIIGLPGETVAIRGGVVHIDGQPLVEPWLALKPHPWFHAPVRLADDEYFVIGDNRTMSQESHSFGVKKRDRIAGKIVR